MKNFNDFCKEHICYRLDEMEGLTIDFSDLAYRICEEENVNGTLTFNRKAAIEYICEWWYDCADYLNYEKDIFGYDMQTNPFSNPEAFMVCMVIEGCHSLLAQCEVVDSNWNSLIELTSEVIETIKEQIKDKTIGF